MCVLLTYCPHVHHPIVSYPSLALMAAMPSAPCTRAILTWPSSAFQTYIISYSPAMAGARDRVSMFWGERKIVEETYLHLKILLPNGARARVHYIGFKALEKIAETLSMV